MSTVNIVGELIVRTREAHMLNPMACLQDGVPLSLVIDLYDTDGPDAMRIYTDEPADVGWIPDPARLTDDSSWA